MSAFQKDLHVCSEEFAFELYKKNRLCGWLSFLKFCPAFKSISFVRSSGYEPTTSAGGLLFDPMPMQIFLTDYSPATLSACHAGPAQSEALCAKPRNKRHIGALSNVFGTVIYIFVRARLWAGPPGGAG